MSGLPRGYVSTEHTVWCCHSIRFGEMPFAVDSTIAYPHGCVSHYQHAGTARAAKEYALAHGWIRTGQFGWLCPACAPFYRRWKQT